MGLFGLFLALKKTTFNKKRECEREKKEREVGLLLALGVE
jgi:hypothetical protein